MLEIFEYAFMQKAFIAGLLIGIACSILGVFLVLRRQALIGDGLAHISFGGIACGLLFGIAPIISALLFGLAGSLGIAKLREKTPLGADAAIGIISHASLGIGIFIISASQGMNTGMLSYLFGSILSIEISEIALSGVLALLAIAFVFLFYHELVSISFDEEAAKISGTNTGFLNYSLAFLTSLVVVGAMPIIGLLLSASLIVLPASSALLLKTSFRRTLFFAALFSFVSVAAGLFLSYYLDAAPSGSIVLANAAIFAGILLYKKIK